jgi:hypothetical protein
LVFFVDEAGVLLGFVLLVRGYFDFAQYKFYRCPSGKRGFGVGLYLPMTLPVAGASWGFSASRTNDIFCKQLFAKYLRE